MKEDQKSIWKIIRFNIEGEGEIHQINEKLGKHLEAVKNIYITIVPTSEIKQDVIEAGELSLSFNNRKDHTVHLTSSYSPELLSEPFDPFALNQNMDKSKQVSGYYRDYGTLKNEFSEFITHQVKILLECTLNNKS